MVNVKFKLASTRGSFVGEFPSASSSDDDGGAGRSGRSCGGEGVWKPKTELAKDVPRGGVMRVNEGDTSVVSNFGVVEGGVPGGVELVRGSSRGGLGVWGCGRSFTF